MSLDYRGHPKSPGPPRKWPTYREHLKAMEIGGELIFDDPRSESTFRSHISVIGSQVGMKFRVNWGIDGWRITRIC